ncbi:Peroxisomal membrane protein (Pex16) [Popillia japonica]
MAHLTVSACFGYNTWKPWMVSFIMDILSLQLYRTCAQGNVKILTKKQRLQRLQLYRTCAQGNVKILTKKQRLQLSRRTFVMLLYLLRSPFYEKYSRQKIEGALNCLSNKVPLLGLLCNPALSALILLENDAIFIDNDTIIGGYNDVDNDKIELVHFLMGKVMLKFVDTLYRDGAINLLRQIFRDVSNDSGASEEN